MHIFFATIMQNHIGVDRDGALRVLPHLCTEVLVKNGWLSDAEADQIREWYPPLIRNDHGDAVGRIVVGGIEATF